MRRVSDKSTASSSHFVRTATPRGPTIELQQLSTDRTYTSSWLNPGKHPVGVWQVLILQWNNEATKLKKHNIQLAPLTSMKRPSLFNATVYHPSGHKPQHLPAIHTSLDRSWWLLGVFSRSNLFRSCEQVCRLPPPADSTTSTGGQNSSANWVITRKNKPNQSKSVSVLSNGGCQS